MKYRFSTVLLLVALMFFSYVVKSTLEAREDRRSNELIDESPSATIKPLQVLFVGNLQGKALSFYDPTKFPSGKPYDLDNFDDYNGSTIQIQCFSKHSKLNSTHLEPCLGLAWRTPDLLDALRHQPPWDTLVIGIGNDHSLHSPSTILASGAIEETLIRACRPDVRALGPLDLILYRRKGRLPAEVENRLWSNPVGVAGTRLAFPAIRRFEKAGRKIAVLCLISESRLDDLPILDWGIEAAENPARCLRRLRPELEDIDIGFVICHLTAADLREVLSEADQRMRFVVVEPSPEDVDSPSHETFSLQALANEIEVSGSKNSLMSAQSKAKLVSIIPAQGLTVTAYRREAREGIFDKERWLNFPITFLRFGKGEQKLLAEPLLQNFKKEWRKPLFYLNFREMPIGNLYRLSPHFLADLVKRSGQTDLALLALEHEWPTEQRELSAEFFMNRYQNKWLRQFQFSASALKTLFSVIGRANFPYRIGLAGATCSFLAGMPFRLAIQGYPVVEGKKYRVMLDSVLYRDPIFLPTLAEATPCGRRGLTLWDAWLESLPQTAHGTPITELEGDRR